MISPKISAIIMTKNEEQNISGAIASLRFADQIVVVDTGSTDKTLEIAKNLGAEIHSIPFEGFGISKGKALKYCSGEWIFYLDADERVSDRLASDILKAVEEPGDIVGYSVSRLSQFIGRPIKHGGWFPDYVLRLFKRNSGDLTNNLVHESVVVVGKVQNLEGILYHCSYTNLKQYVEKMNLYSALSARQLFDSKRKFNAFDLLIHPPAVFFKMYFTKLGILDGFHGFILAILSSVHVLLKYAKLWELWLHEKNQ